MKMPLRKALSVMLSVTLMVCIFSVSFSAGAEDATATALRFNEDGKFKIVVFADCQDIVLVDGRLIKMIEKTLDTENPDLVVFLGDNVVQPVGFMNKQAFATLLAPLAERDIPFAYVYGNHDAENLAKEIIHENILAAGAECLTYDADESLTGLGTCNIPIYSSADDSMAFNLWMIDSNMYDEENGGYDYVHQDQLDWYTRTSQAIEAQQGRKVDSLVFQHIIVPEIYYCLNEATADSANTRTRFGGTWELSLNPEYAEGVINEWPCPSDTNSGELDTMAARGDVLGIVTGHDHVNSFIARYNGIDLIQTAGMCFHSYGDDSVRGYRTITLDENDTSTYETETHTYIEYFPDETLADYGFGNLACYLSELIKLIGSLFEAIANIVNIAKS